MTESRPDAHLARSFGQQAATYDQARPRYPDAAVAQLLPPGARDIVDVGAGTGILTAALVGPGRNVVAVDPDPKMLEQLSANLPDVRAEVGTAEQLPLPEDFADVLVYAQAWHWVDPVAGCAEAARVLRPGGTLALIWNIRDESVDWVAELGEVMGHTGAEAMLFGDGPSTAPPFVPLELREFRWERDLTVDELVQNAASRSTVITASTERSAEILAGVHDLATAQVTAAPGGRLALPYVTSVFVATNS